MNGLEVFLAVVIAVLTICVATFVWACVGAAEGIADALPRRGYVPDNPNPPPRPMTQGEKDEAFRRKCQEDMNRLSWPGLWW